MSQIDFTKVERDCVDAIALWPLPLAEFISFLALGIVSFGQRPVRVAGKGVVESVRVELVLHAVFHQP